MQRGCLDHLVHMMMLVQSQIMNPDSARVGEPAAVRASTATRPRAREEGPPPAIPSRPIESSAHLRSQSRTSRWQLDLAKRNQGGLPCIYGLSSSIRYVCMHDPQICADRGACVGQWGDFAYRSLSRTRTTLPARWAPWSRAEGGPSCMCVHVLPLPPISTLSPSPASDAIRTGCAPARICSCIYGSLTQ
jgi:hypothetical protein